jgi:hypothetical protein
MEVLEEYKKGLKAVEVEEVFDLVFYRPLAFLFVKLIYRTDITPNQLTVISMFLGLFGGASYVFGTAAATFAGGVFYLLYNIIDCSDGQLARLKKNGTELGRILDGVADYVVSVAAYVGIGIGYAGNSSSPGLFWVLTAVAGISNAIQSGLLDFYRNRFLDVMLDRVSILDDGLRGFQQEYESICKQPGHTFEKAMIWIYLKYSRVQRSLTSAEKKARVTSRADAKEYYAHNRVLIHFWTYLGPTTQWTLLIVCSFFNRLDIYLWGIAGVGNILAVIMMVLQKRCDATLSLSET